VRARLGQKKDGVESKTYRVKNEQESGKPSVKLRTNRSGWGDRYFLNWGGGGIGSIRRGAVAQESAVPQVIWGGPFDPGG